MTKSKKIARLQALTEMVLEVELTKLRKVDAQRLDTQCKIDGLRPPPAILNESLGPSDAIAALHYQTWADIRRAELHQTLAAQTAIWMDQRDQARIAFGKARGFQSVVKKTLA